VGGTLVSNESPSLVGFRETRASLLRDGLRKRHARLFQSLDGHGVIAAMTTGDRRGMSRVTQNAFGDAGLAHLLAISGFHVGVIGWGLYVLVGGICIRCGLGPRGSVILRGLITVLVVALFAHAAGGSPSTIRAAVMASIILGRKGLGRRGLGGMHALGLAALAFLVLRPEGMLSAGFAMSVLAVYGLLADVRGSRKLVSATLCAVLFTSPIAAGLFGKVVPVSLISNLVAGPVTALVLYGALFAHLAPLPALSAASATAADLLAQGLVWWAGAFSNVDGIPVAGFRAMLLLPALLVGRLPRTASGRLTVTTALVLVIVLTPPLTAPRRQLEVTFLDVGQGDAILVESPGGRVLLVDTGPPSADYTIRSAVQHSAVDMTLITHPHRDHNGALASLIREEILDLQHLKTVHAGDRIELDPELLIQVLAPGPSPRPTSPNDASVVLLIRHGDISFLLLGDAERRTEQFLVETWGPLLEADVVKVAHHGSKTSSHPFLVSRFGEPDTAQFAIISVAAENRFGLPDESVIQTWQNHGYTVMSTAQAGSIRCRSTGRSVTCKPFAQLSR
jgi:competence protein ComEC